MEVELQQIPLDIEKDQNIISKSLTGKFPMLELEDGNTYISESLSITRYLSNGKHDFYGPSIQNKVKVE